MNELILVENIEKRLREKREPPIFPLSPTHRKELRELRDRNVGDLRERLRIIKQLKKEEYKKKYFTEIQTELKKVEHTCKLLNEDWTKRIEKMNEILRERKELENKNDIKCLDLKCSWNKISELKEIKEEERKFIFDKNDMTNHIAEKEFERKYAKSFELVSKKIDDIYTKYEEAINFGDLEIVKALYYIMKTAENFFDKVNNLRI